MPQGKGTYGSKKGRPPKKKGKKKGKKKYKLIASYDGRKEISRKRKPTKSKKKNG